MSRDAIHHEATHGGEIWYPHCQGVLRSSAELISNVSFHTYSKKI
jgi:hypothetical protein